MVNSAADSRLPVFHMHGLGNRFVIVDARGLGNRGIDLPLGAALAKLASGHLYDQLLVISNSDAADAFMGIFNRDGSASAACGNGARCVAALLMRESGENQGRLETGAGILDYRIVGDGIGGWPIVAMDMGEPKFGADEIPLSVDADTLHLTAADFGEVSDPTCVNMGNPHAVFFVSDGERAPVTTLGPVIETDQLFPERVNVEFAEVVDREHIRLRVWERGVGETEACGSGACAAAVAAVRRDLADRQVQILLNGGALEIDWRDDNHVWMTGPVAFEGEESFPLPDLAVS